MSLDKVPDELALDDWFVSEVLSLEPVLMRFLRRHWQDGTEVADLRQEAFLRVYEAARSRRPVPVQPFLLSVARNLVIDRLRRKRVVSIDFLGEADWLTLSDQEPSPEHRVSARQDLQRLQAALNQLPPRCRQVIVLRRVYGLSQRETAREMGITEETVESQMAKGIRLLADAMSDPPSVVRKSRRFWTRGN